MRFLELALFISVCALACASSSNTDDLVASALKESSERYNSQMLAATKLGAQSKARGAKSTPFADKIGEISNIHRTALDILTTRHKVEKQEALKLLAKHVPEEFQLQEITCDPASKYRTIDGTCNNLDTAKVRWGAANIPFIRLLPAKYEDDKDEPRGGRNSILPNVRTISLQIHVSDDEKPDSTITHMVPQFGQFLDHDITLTPEGGLACCSMPEESRPEPCWAIAVGPGDPFYSAEGRNINCLDFTRSTAYLPTGTDGIRQQMNAITAYIDGSQVYGSDKRVMKMLREFQGGRLEGNSEHAGFLPWTSDVDPGVQAPGRTKAGDVRSDEMPGLAVMHSLFHREHNRIAGEFALKTSWSDEEIFQETRRIVIAELQQITYTEFLPIILGPTLMQEHNLNLPAEAASTTYDADVNASIFNSFAVAAYRFGHTMVNGLIKFLINGALGDGYNVRDHYFDSTPIVSETNGYDHILGGLITQTSQSFDGEIHGDMTNFLFRRMPQNFGSDLAARNIQRGRDHGAPGYNEFRQHCGLPALIDWDTRPENIPDAAWEKLRTVYTDVLDIDIYTGGLVEERIMNGQSGATFACIMGEQFENLKDGDRFFFTHSGQTGSFTTQQLQALRKRTLGDIICENSGLEETSSNVFKTDDPNNPKVKCTEASRKLDISLFYPEDVTTTTENGVTTTTENGVTTTTENGVTTTTENGVTTTTEGGASGLQLINMSYIILFVLFSSYYLF